MLRFLRYMRRRNQRNEILSQAAALSFSSVLAIIPMLALAYFSFSALGGFDKIESLMETYIINNIAPSFAENLKEYLAQIKENVSAKTMGVFGLIAFSVTSILTISKIENTLNRIWGIHKPRSLFKKGILYWGMITLAPILLGTSFYLSTKLMTMIRFDALSSLFAFVSGTILPVLFSGLAFSSLYWLLPNFKVKKRAAFSVGYSTAFVFEIAKQLYSYYAAVALGNSFYGSLAVLPVFLLWLYVAWALVLMGAEVCVWVHYKFDGGTWDVGESYHPYLLVDLLQRIHLQNERAEAQSLSFSRIVKEFDVSPEELLRHLVWMEDQNLIMQVKTKDKEAVAYAPVRRERSKNLKAFFEKYSLVDYPSKESWASRQREYFYNQENYD
ncbi:MAG: YihY family inner membrane protein [Bdellovibrionota bacterium]|tara:strand:+ start:44209 stop:45363 length:1155 start_codon:yes stop_codon:yes gene_type:complete